MVENLDLDRYLGKWYEIARFPNRFERGCARRDRGIRACGPTARSTVRNTCRKGSPDGPVEVAEGEASVVAPGKLEVTFVPWLPFAKGDYWVLHVDAAYSVAVVGEPSGKHRLDPVARPGACRRRNTTRPFRCCETWATIPAQLERVAQ